MQYFEWTNLYDRNNCILCLLTGDGTPGELSTGKPLARQRKKPYVYAMDPEYKKNVRLTDSLMNNQSSIVASPRLKDFLLQRLGKKIEALPVHIKDHKGRIASKDYSFINLLDVQDCLDAGRSGPLIVQKDGKPFIVKVKELALFSSRIAKDSLLFRISSYMRPIIVREDLAAELEKEKFEVFRLNPATTV